MDYSIQDIWGVLKLREIWKKAEMVRLKEVRHNDFI